MFSIDNDMTISITRGDVATIPVSAVGEAFKLGDIIRIKVFEKKNCANVIFQKDFGVAEESESMDLILTRYETKIGETINKPKTYWYEIELNPDTAPNTIVGYDEDGPKLFVLYPEGEDIEYIPPTEEEIGPIDDELSLTSKKPIANYVVAKRTLELDQKIDESAEKEALNRANDIASEKKERVVAIANEKAERKAEIAIERERINQFVALPEGSTQSDAEIKDIRVGVDGTAYKSAGESVRSQVANLRGEIVTAIGEVTEEIEPEVLEVTRLESMYYDKTTGTVTGDVNSNSQCTAPVSVTEGQKFFVTGQYGDQCCLIAEFDEADTFIRGVGTTESGTEIATDYEYTVPSGVSFIVFSTLDKNNYPLIVTTSLPAKTHLTDVKGDLENIKNGLDSALNKVTYIKDLTNTLTTTQGYYSKTSGSVTGAIETNLATEKIPVKKGDKFYISGAYGYYACLIAEFDENETFIQPVMTAESTTSVIDYEYIVPEGVAYIGCCTRNTSYPLCVKKLVTEYTSVADAIEEAKEEVYNKTYFDVTNVCVNGNFEDATGWEASNTSTELSVADNVATASLIGENTGVVGIKQTVEVPQVANTVCFVSAKVKVPKEAQYIRLNMNTVDGYVSLHYVAPKIYDDYITICGVKRFNGTTTGYPVLFLTATLPANYSDFAIQIKEVTIIKDIDSSLTDEQISTLYSAILEQNGGYIDGTVNVIGAEGLLNKLANEHKNDSVVTADKVVTVGAEGDFPTINSALRYLSKFYPAYLDGGISCEVKILDGTIINEQIHLERIDLSHISITTDNANNTVQVDSTGWGGVTHDTRGNRPFFSAEYGARLPAIKCLFSCIVPEGGWTSSNCTVGYFCNRGSTGVICGEATYSGSNATGLANVGFENFYDNIIANNNSEIVLREAISRNAGRYGVMARHISRVSARSSDITNCADTGAYADRSSMMDVRFADVSGCYNGLQAFNTSNMTAVETIANNIANVVADSREGSVINCAEMTIDNAKDIFKVLNGGTIIATGTAPTNVTGTLYNKDKNTIDVNGIIYG